MNLKILFAGDFAPCRNFEDITRLKHSDIFGDLIEEIKQANLSFLNLETPLCRNGESIKKSGPNIRAHPECVKAIADAGFDVAGLANNHIMDFGPEGLKETMENCEEAGIQTCGAGKNLYEARKPLLVERLGVKIAIIAVAEHEFNIAEENKPGAAPLDPIENLVQLELSRKQADLVFITVHGGNEYFPYPRPGLRKLCRFFIERGADAVICHHAHVPGAYEFYQDKPIIYSLGNLIFDSSNPPEGWGQGYSIRLEYDTESRLLKSYEFIPYTQFVCIGGIRKLQGHEKDSFLSMLKIYENNLSNSKTYASIWEHFCRNRMGDVSLRMFFPFKIRGLGKLSKLIPFEKIIIPKSSAPIRFNYITCESHHELLACIMEKKCK